MGFLRKLLKKDLTPEEQELRSRQEKEWAEKYYRAGERFGEKIGFKQKVDAINAFGNKYPKTFFGIIFALLIACFALNFTISSTAGLFRHEAENIETISNMNVGVGNEGREIISREARKIVEQMEVLKNEIETIIAKDSLTHADSLVVKNKLIELKKLNDILN